jgi:predicted RNase H-like HicB family nuclease
VAKEYKYEIIIYWSDEDEAFIAEVPEFPGRAADGSTYAAALANVDVIIQEWIETGERSRPSDTRARRALNVRVTSANRSAIASRRRP